MVPLKPRLSEKNYALSKERRTYVFDAPKSANKHALKQAVEAQFGVEVSEVNIANIKGKSKQTYRKRGRVIKGHRADVSKAYIRLKEGHSMPIFEAVEAAEKKAAEGDKPNKEKK